MPEPELRELAFRCTHLLYRGLERRGYNIRLTEDPQRDDVVGLDMMDPTDDEVTNWYIEYSPIFQYDVEVIKYPAELGLPFSIGLKDERVTIFVRSDEDAQSQYFLISDLDDCLDYFEQVYEIAIHQTLDRWPSNAASSPP